MFTGIVEEVGKISGLTTTAEGTRLKISAPTVTEGVKLGDSISIDGTCLTVVEFGADWFAVEATPHTLRMTGLGALKPGSRVNLERALRLSDRLGGHIVSGHVDGRARVESIEQEGISRIVTFAAPQALAAFFVEKGSVAVAGVSLTVARLAGSGGQVDGCFRFAVALIPHTMEVTTLGELSVGDEVNIEADLIAKYVARLAGESLGANINKPGLSLSFLQEHGYT